MTFWRWMGYREARALAPKEWGTQYGGSRICFRLSIWQRVLALFSGKVMVDIAHKFDRPPRNWRSVSDFSVLPPNYPVDQPK